MSFKLESNSAQNQLFRQMADLCSENLLERAADSALLLPTKKAQEIALTIIHHPLYTPEQQALRLRYLAGDPAAIRSCGNRLDQYEKQENELRQVFFYEIGLRCFTRENKHGKIHQVMASVFKELSGAIVNGGALNNLALLVKEYVGGGKELFIIYQRMETQAWLQHTFQLNEFRTAYFGRRVEDAREPFHGERLDLWMPDSDSNLIVSSKFPESPFMAAKVDKACKTLSIVPHEDQSSALKTFACCTPQETRDVMKLLAERQNSFRIRTGTRLFKAMHDSDYQFIKVLSPKISCIAFHTAAHDRTHDPEVLVRVQGLWISCKQEIIKGTEHRCAARGSTLPCYDSKNECCDRIPLDKRPEFGQAVRAWPWTYSHKLCNGIRLNLTSNPPCLLHEEQSFAVEPITEVWSGPPSYYGVNNFWNFGRRYGRELQFSTLSSVLLLPEEGEEMENAMRTAISPVLSEGVIRLIERYWDINSLVMPY